MNLIDVKKQLHQTSNGGQIIIIQQEIAIV